MICSYTIDQISVGRTCFGSACSQLRCTQGRGSRHRPRANMILLRFNITHSPPLRVMRERLLTSTIWTAGFVIRKTHRLQSQTWGLFKRVCTASRSLLCSYVHPACGCAHAAYSVHVESLSPFISVWLHHCSVRFPEGLIYRPPHHVTLIHKCFSAFRMQGTHVVLLNM